jgi:hypothetical protein
MNIENIKEYLEINHQIKVLTEKQDALSIAIFDEMKETSVKKFMTDLGTFSIFSRSKYIFPEDIQNKIDGLKAQAATLAVLNKSKATAEKSESLRFQGIK